ncbi:MAG: 1-deoxy-D-xylulose-5-phosphate reductoisomerase [Gemmatimonadales bacterium]|nr:1-deoxy-D-xylulose-5-phosphate reductoisomerase [Gemmatimonadales bacterium]
MTTGIALLGSTGSIGQSTLQVLRRHRDRFRLVAMTGGKQAELFAAQVGEFRPAFARLVNGGGVTCAPGIGSAGPEALVEAATHPDVRVVLNAVVGAAGLQATLAALRAGKRVALANKESLVTGGALVLEAARAGGGEIVPVDSEHSAVLQCLGGRAAPARRLVLTASGGPFRTWPAERVQAATVQEALRHPTWSMGAKITIDSATLANKALELIEAHFLFGLGYDQLDAVVHPQSIVHALVEFADRSVLAQVGFPTMELPILYALTHPDRLPDDGVPAFDPVQASPLTFEPVRRDVFRAFALGLDAGRAGGTAPCVFNAANEVAVAAFLEGRIGFGGIADVIARALDLHRPGPAADVPTVQDADQWARRTAAEAVARTAGVTA